ncbi:MAG: winged helix-turn-helix domain-containing protein [Haliea sp.]
MTNTIRYNFADASFLPDRNRLEIDGCEHMLEKKVSDLLDAFCRRPGQVLTKHWLLDEIWPQRVVNEDSLSVAVSKLRRVLNDNRSAPRFVKTISGTGYLWLPAVEIETLAEGRQQATGLEFHPPARKRTYGGRVVRRGLIVALALSVTVAVWVNWPHMFNRPETVGGRPLSGEPLSGELAQLHQQAQRQLQSDEAEQLRQVVIGYRRVIDTRPDFIGAYLGIAEAKLQLSALNGFRELDLYAEEIHALLDHVLVEQPNNSRAWLRKAEIVFLGDWNMDAAEAAYRKAIQYGPDDPQNYLSLTEFLIIGGEFQRAEQVLTQLRIRNPSHYQYLNMSFVYLMRGELELALAEARRLLNSEAQSDSYHKIIHRAALLLGDYDLAFSAFKEIVRDQQLASQTVQVWEEIYRGNGIEALFGHLLAERVETNIGHYWPPIAWARYAVTVGDVDAALEWLGQAIDDRQPQALFLGVDPHYLPLRSHPRFQALLERLPNQGARK